MLPKPKVSKHIQTKYSNESYKELNAIIYYKPNETISSIRISSTYKIKELYLSDDFKEHLMHLFTYRISDEIIIDKVKEYITLNYDKSDIDIYMTLRVVIHNDVDIYSHILDLPNLDKYTLDLQEDGNNDKLQHLNLCYPDSRKSVYLNKLSELYIMDSKIFEISSIDAPKFEYESKSFDAITIYLCLHHVPVEHLNTLFDEVTRVLSDSGQLIITEYDMNPLIRNNTNLLDVLYSYYNINTKSITVGNYNTINYWNNFLLDRNFTLINSKKNDDIFNIKTVIFVKSNDL